MNPTIAEQVQRLETQERLLKELLGEILATLEINVSRGTLACADEQHFKQTQSPTPIQPMNTDHQSQPRFLAAVYGRVSTDKQDESLQLQEQRVYDYAQFRRFTIGEGLIFLDPDTSGRTPIMERLGGRALMNRLKLGDIRHLVVAKIDRLGRNVRDALGVLEFLKVQGITLHITDFGGESITTQGHMGKMILTIMLAFSEWEVEEIRDRTLKITRAKFERNELVGNIPFGFDCVYTFVGPVGTYEETHSIVLSAEDLAGREVTSKILVNNPREQSVIFLIDKLRWGPREHRAPNPTVRASLKKVADELNRLGYQTKQGKPWSCGSVDSVLNSRHSERVLKGHLTDEGWQLQTSPERRNEVETSALTE